MYSVKPVSTSALIVLFLMAISAQSIFAQEKVYVIPFQLTPYNNFSVPAILNKKDTLHLMFHTAADGLTLTEDATKKINTLHFDGADSVKSWGGNDNSSRYSRNNTLQIGALQWDSLVIYEDKNSGRNTDGKFGADLFTGKVIVIDFDKQQLAIETSLPKNIRKYQKLKLSFKNNNMFMEAGCRIGDSTYINKFLLHSGYSGSVLLDDKFVADNRIADQLQVIDVKDLKDSYGHIIKTKKAILPALVIGDQTLTQVPVGFFEGSIGRQKTSIIGGDILKRFNIVIDAKREYIYLKPNHNKKSVYA